MKVKSVNQCLKKDWDCPWVLPGLFLTGKYLSMRHVTFPYSQKLLSPSYVFILFLIVLFNFLIFSYSFFNAFPFRFTHSSSHHRCRHCHHKPHRCSKSELDLWFAIWHRLFLHPSAWHHHHNSTWNTDLMMIFVEFEPIGNNCPDDETCVIGMCLCVFTTKQNYRKRFIDTRWSGLGSTT